MTLKELRLFIQLADLGSVTNVATSLGIAQSAVSRQIADLEAGIGERLFHRTGRGLVPTDHAESLLPRARALFADMQQFSDDAKARASKPIGTVTVGFVPAVAAPFSGLLFNRLRQAHPGIELSLFEGYSGEIDAWLASGKIEIGILNRYRADSPIRFEPLFSTDVMLVGAKGSMHVKNPMIEFKGLAGVPLVDTVTPSTLHGVLGKLARQHGITLNIKARSDSPRAIFDLIASSGLYCTLPQHAVAAQLASGEFQAARIVNPSLPQKVVMATSTRQPLSESARQATKILLELGREMAAERQSAVTRTFKLRRG